MRRLRKKQEEGGPRRRALLGADIGLLRFMRTHGHTTASEAVAKKIALSGEYGAVWFATGALAAALDQDRRARWATAAALAPVAIGLNFGVKLIVKRQRPKLKGLPPLGSAPSSLSFPSAHSTASFASATAMSRIAPGGAPLFYGGATLMGLSRPFLGMHYPSDVVAGAILGTLLGKLVPLPAEHAMPDPISYPGPPAG